MKNGLLIALAATIAVMALLVSLAPAADDIVKKVPDGVRNVVTVIVHKEWTRYPHERLLLHHLRHHSHLNRVTCNVAQLSIIDETDANYAAFIEQYKPETLPAVFIQAPKPDTSGNYPVLAMVPTERCGDPDVLANELTAVMQKPTLIAMQDAPAPLNVERRVYVQPCTNCEPAYVTETTYQTYSTPCSTEDCTCRGRRCQPKQQQAEPKQEVINIQVPPQAQPEPPPDKDIFLPVLLGCLGMTSVLFVVGYIVKGVNAK
jgi:hypothetical protein